MKLVQLDAARGLASIIVVFHHYTLAFASELRAGARDDLSGNLWGWTINGTAAVCFFFVLSGFVLTRRYFETAEHGLLVRGALKRYPRLHLSCAISILLGVAVLNTGFEWTAAAADLSGSKWLREFGNAGLPHDPPYSLAAAFRQSVLVLLVPSNSYFNSNLWTMVFEFWGSLACFALAAILLFVSRVRLWGAVLLTALILFVFTRYYYLVSGGYALNLLGSSMVFGCFVSMLDSRGLRLPPATAIPLLVAGLIACSQFTITFDKVGGGLLLLGLLAFRTPPRLLTGRAGVYLGDLSFPLYLVHTVVLLSVGTLVFVRLDALGVAGPLLHGATLAAIFAVSLILCAFVIRVEGWWVPLVNRVVRRSTYERIRARTGTFLRLLPAGHDTPTAPQDAIRRCRPTR